MARVQIQTLGWGWLVDGAGNPRPGVTVSLSGPVYAAATGAGTVTPTSASNGVLPGWVEPGTYTLTDGGSSYTVDALNGVIPPSATAGTAVQTAISALGAAGGIIVLGVGAHTWDVTPALPRNLTGRLLIACQPGVTITLTAGGKRLFDFAKIADYDTFRYIELDGNGATVDCNNVAASGAGDHVLVGTLQSGTWQQRINFQDITIKRWKTINVPVAAPAANRRFNVALHVYHQTLGEATQTTCKRVLIEDCDLAGGDYGVLVAGSYLAGGTGEVNHYLDDIVIRRVKHDTGVVPTAFVVHANFHIASRAQGGKVTITDCEGINSGDVGFEVDGMQTAVLERNRTTDSWTGGVLLTNFQAAPYPESQTMVCRDHHHQIINMTPTAASGTSLGYTVNGNNGPTVGHAIFERCKVTDRATNLVVSGSAVNAGVGPYRKLTIRDFTYVKDQINSTVTVAAQPVFFRINSTTVDSELVMDNIRIKVAGTLGAGSSASTLLRPIRLGGTSTKQIIDIERVYFDVNVTNLTVSGGGFYGIDLGEPTASVMTGRISRVVVEQLNITPLGIIVVRDTATLTITPAIIVEHCDFTAMSGGNDEIYFVSATTRSKLILRGNLWRTAASNVINIAAAAVVTLPDIDELVVITGNTNITSAFGMRRGAKVTVKFSGTPTVSAGAGQKLAGGVNFVATADDLLTVASDGTTVYEIARSVNA